MKLCLFINIILALCITVLFGLPLKINPEDSAINAVVIPYSPYSTELIRNSKGITQKVYVPDRVNIVPRINLKQGEIAMGSQKGSALNLAEGAYPVYYMSGSANGKFHNKRIYVLE